MKMKMKIDILITPGWLAENNACNDGAEWGLSVIGKGMLFSELAPKFNHADWLLWTIQKLGALSKVQYVELSVVCAVTVLHIYEESYPQDDRPRKALEAAKSYFRDPSEENQIAALSAARAAHAASSAASNVAYSAYAASDASSCAISAAPAASAASHVAASAAAAADAAVAAYADAAAFTAIYSASRAAAVQASDSAYRAEQDKQDALMCRLIVGKLRLWGVLRK